MVGFRAWDVLRRVGARSSALFALGVLSSGGCAGKSTGDDPTSDPCPAFCERARKCPGAPALPLTCDDACLQEDTVAELTGCYDVYKKSVACSSKLTDACTLLTACGAEVNATHDCEVTYCNAHQGADACIGVM